MSRVNEVDQVTTKMSFWKRNEISGGYLLKKTVKRKCIVILRAFLMFGLCFLILQPIFNKISVSFMLEKDLYDSTVISLPKNFTNYNYHLSAQLLSYWKALGNTLLVSTAVSILQVAMCTLVGYGFARFEFPLKKFWFFCVLLVIVIPPQTISTSLYLNFRFFDLFGIIESVRGSSLNLRGSILPYFLMCLGCMGLKDGLYIYMIRQSFRGIPKELEEAAYVDGCGVFTTFLKIMLPDCRAIITACFLFSFVWQWTDVFYSKMFLGKITLLAGQLNSLGDRLGKYFSSTLGIASGATQGYTMCIISTGTLMTIIPLIMLYIIAQRGFVESLSQTGIKM